MCVIGRASFFLILRVGRAGVNRAEKAGFCARRLYNPAKRRYALPKMCIRDRPIWEGDKIFFRLLNEERPWFSLKLVYEGDTLRQAVLDGKRVV